MMSPEASPPRSSPRGRLRAAAACVCSLFVIRFAKGGLWSYVCMYDGSARDIGRLL